MGAGVAKGSVLLACQAGSSPVLHATLTAQHTPPVNLLLHRGFWMCTTLCSVHTPMTIEVHIREQREKHPHSGRLQGLCKFSGFCLFAMQHNNRKCRVRRAVRCGLVHGMSWACAWLQAQPFDKTSELCYFLYLNFV